MRIEQMQPIDEYKLLEVLEAAQEELVKLTQERERIDWRINKLQNDIVHLAALCRVEVEDPIKQLGLTDAIRWIFARDDKPLGTQQVADVLEQSYDVSGYKNLAANVHTIVRRLVKAGDIKLSNIAVPLTLRKVGEDREKYVWAGGLPPPPPRRLSAAPKRVKDLTSAPSPPRQI